MRPRIRFSSKKILLIFILSVAFCPGLLRAQSKNVKKIMAVIREEEQTWSRGDIDGYVNLYAPLDSTRMILSKGCAYGKENILAFYQKYWPKEKMGTLKLDVEGLEKLSGRYYYITGFFHVTYPDGKKMDGRYSGLMRKIKGRWYIYTDHSG